MQIQHFVKKFSSLNCRITHVFPMWVENPIALRPLCYDLYSTDSLIPAVSLNDVWGNKNKHFFFHFKGQRHPSASSHTTSIQTRTTTRAPSLWRSYLSARYFTMCFIKFSYRMEFEASELRHTHTCSILESNQCGKQQPLDNGEA